MLYKKLEHIQQLGRQEMVKKLGEEEEPTKDMRKQPVRQEENQKGVHGINQE